MGCPVVHFEIGCRDSEKTRKFYCELFGWTAQSNETSTEIKTGADSGVQGHITSLGHEPHNYVNIYIAVDDLEAYAKRAEQLGGAILIPPTEIPGGRGWFAWINDPEGTTVGLYRAND